MKAVLALIVMYVVAFLIAIQGGPAASVEASAQDTTQNAPSNLPSMDSPKAADIRALLDLVGAREQVRQSLKLNAEQYREKLLASVAQSDEKDRVFVNTVISGYEARFNVDQVTDDLVAIYDKHYSADEVRGLLRFYQTPLGQKVAQTSPQIAREVQEAVRLAGTRAVKDALQQAESSQGADLEIGAHRSLRSEAPQHSALVSEPR